MFDIISIGAATVDILAKSDSLIVKDDFLTLPYSSKNEISDGFIGSGGGATNSSASFSNLGLKSACVSLLGDDPISGYVLNDLKKYSVDSSLLIQSENETTDHSIVLIAPDGGRSILTDRGDSRLEEKNIDWEKIKDTKWFYITSLEGNIELLEKLIGFAQENNIKISLNPGLRELKQKNHLFPLLKFVDFFLLNKTEAEMFTEIRNDNPNFWKSLFTCGAKITAVTNGREGAHVLFENENYYSPIINIKPVDELGAGDSFGSAFVAGLIYNLPPQDALFWGIKNSASVVSKMGAKPGLLTFEQINSN